MRLVQARFYFLVLLAVGIALICRERVWGHAPGENYVWLNVEANHISGRFEVHVNDLRKKLGLDLGKFGADRLAAASETAPIVQEYLSEHFQIEHNGQPIPLEFRETSLFEVNPAYVQYHYCTPDMEIPQKLLIKNTIFLSQDLMSKDPLHRSLIVVEYNKHLGEDYGAENTAMVFGPHRKQQELDLTDLPSVLKPLDFVWQGVLHIWIGIDHILFLVALLLSAVLIRQDNSWEPVPLFRHAFWNIIKIVTVFTIAHSITLSLAALDFVSINSRLVESTIAASIVVVSVNNIAPRFRDKTWLVIFLFGLFHGLGFASVMGELPFRTVFMLRVLVAFNVGVELGQLAIVMAIFPLIFLLRRTKIYVPVALYGASVAICLIAANWFVERAFGRSVYDTIWGS